ncbi:MAG TPA: hypothetical protein PK050_14785 [Hyphomonadaceae bacterium]|nr:hypothetical protein [Hyphomonadaceae bacterium]
MAAVLALLIVMWGVKTGLVEGFATQRLETAEGLRVYVTAQSPISLDQVTWLRRQPETAFVQPNISFSNSRGLMQVMHAGSVVRSDVLLLPTGAGDPHLPQGIGAPGPGEVVLGDDTAQALGLKQGDRLQLLMDARSADQSEHRTLLVRGIARTSRWFDRVALLDPALVLEIEARATGAAPALQPPQSYASVRLYARSSQDVARLVSRMRGEGWNAQARELLINERKAIEALVASIFWTIFLLAAAALSVIIGLGLVSRAQSLVKPLMAMRVNGMTRLAVMAVPFVQAGLQSTLAWLIAVSVSYGVATALNTLLPVWLDIIDVTSQPCIIDPGVVLIIGAGLLATTLAATAAAAPFFDSSRDLKGAVG